MRREEAGNGSEKHEKGTRPHPQLPSLEPSGPIQTTRGTEVLLGERYLVDIWQLEQATGKDSCRKQKNTGICTAVILPTLLTVSRF